METLRFLLGTTFYPPYHLGGDAVHVRYLAEALAARGHEVHVEFSPAAYRLKRKDRPARPKENGVRLHPIPSPFGRAQPLAAHQLGRAPGVSRFHAHLLKDLRPDVVHLHNISLLGLGVLRHPSGTAVLYTAHDYWARCPRSDLLKYGRAPCERPACMRCALVSKRPPQLWRYGTRWRGLPGIDRAIAPSRFMARAMADAFACPVEYIPNFVPDPNPSGEASQPGDYFLFVGVLEEHKGILMLARAASGPGAWRVKVLGVGSLQDQLSDFVLAGARMDLEGWVSGDPLQDLYRRARALIVPSTCLENAPLVALEALAWGTPLLVSPRGGLEELLYGGLTGRSFDPSPDTLREAIQCFEDEDLPRRLRVPARLAYEAHHRPENYLDRYLAVVRASREGTPDDVPTATVGHAPVPLFPPTLSGGHSP